MFLIWFIEFNFTLFFQNAIIPFAIFWKKSHLYQSKDKFLNTCKNNWQLLLLTLSIFICHFISCLSCMVWIPLLWPLLINFSQSIAYLEDEYSSVKEEILKSVGKEADAKTLACLKAIREDLRSNLVEYVNHFYKLFLTRHCNMFPCFISIFPSSHVYLWRSSSSYNSTVLRSIDKMCNLLIISSTRVNWNLPQLQFHIIVIIIGKLRFSTEALQSRWFEFVESVFVSFIDFI